MSMSAGPLANARASGTSRPSGAKTRASTLPVNVGSVNPMLRFPLDGTAKMTTAAPPGVVIGTGVGGALTDSRRWVSMRPGSTPAGGTKKSGPLATPRGADTLTTPLLTPTGTTARMLVGDTDRTSSGRPPIATTSLPSTGSKPLPVIVNSVDSGPLVGLIPVMTGGGGTTVNVPPATVVPPTRTVSGPVLAFGGTLSVMLVSDTGVTVTGTPLNDTVAEPAAVGKPVPVMVMGALAFAATGTTLSTARVEDGYRATPTTLPAAS
jgi:hypothetical protein